MTARVCSPQGEEGWGSSHSQRPEVLEHPESVNTGCPMRSPQKTCRACKNALEGGRELLHQTGILGKMEGQVSLQEGRVCQLTNLAGVAWV